MILQKLTHFVYNTMQMTGRFPTNYSILVFFEADDLMNFQETRRTFMLLGDFKQEIMKRHNTVNVKVFGQGLRWQRVEIIQDKIIIIANNKRVKALTTLDEKDRFTTRLIDIALLVEFKELFRNDLMNFLNCTPPVVLKDYDPSSEISMCAVLLDKDVQEMLPGL